MRLFSVILALCLSGVVLAQSSPSYRLEESAINAGGHPHGGSSLSSTSYRVSLDALGEAVTAPELSSTTYTMDAGFARSYRPPAEVRQVVALGDKKTLAWTAERSAGSYSVYGGNLLLPPVTYGVCRISGIPAQQVQLEEEPGVGGVFFYLVTARNPLFEEGTKGYDSSGTHRHNPTPCP